MNHYSSAEWADFSREQTSGALRFRMQGHLSSGCQACMRKLRVWKTVREFASRESGYKPDEGVVRTARAVFAAAGSKSRSGVAAQTTDLVEMVFDSFAQGDAAGVRSTGGTARHMLYRAGLLHIDLQVESQADSDQVWLVGQILGEGSEGLSDVSITLSAGSNALAEARTNQFGEFHFNYAKTPGLSLTIAMTGRKEIVVPIDELHERHEVRRSGRPT
jgi:hypothetical protein